jgi:TonB family protein
MRSVIMIWFGILMSSRLIAQDTKLIVKYFQNSKQIMEEYYVLSDNENIKHGSYIQYFRTSDKGFLEMKGNYMSKEGFYFKNQPDSTWIYYSYKPGGHSIAKEEKYKNGKRIGIWKTYIENGAVVKRFDYDLNKEIEPEIRIYAPYPSIASEMGIEGNVKVRVVYNNDCTVSGISVVQSASRTLESDAVNYVSKIEKLRIQYSMITDCSTRKDSTYTIRYKLHE